MGATTSSYSDNDNFGDLSNELLRQARHFTEAAVLTHNEFVGNVEEINKLSRSCMDAHGRQLMFLIKPGTDSGLLWKANVAIVCYRFHHETRTIDGFRKLTLGQFLKLYKSIKTQFDAASNLNNSIKGEENRIDPATFIESLELDNLSNECCICFERQHEVVLPCMHSFCQPCIHLWSVTHKTCPICREDLGKEQDEWILANLPNTMEIEEELVTSVMEIINENDSSEES